MGLNQPFIMQYINWLVACLHGDFGVSYTIASGKPVASLLLMRLWPTIKLALLALVIMLVFSVPLGILSAIHQNKPRRVGTGLLGGPDFDFDFRS